MAVVKHALAAIVHKSQFHARSIGPRRGAGSNGKELPERGASLFDSDPDLTRDVARGGLVGVRKSGNRVVGLRARRRYRQKGDASLTRNEHFIVNIVSQSKCFIYLYFFGSVRKMSECFSQ